MAFPADTPLTATAVATGVVSIGLASLVWWRRLARLERVRRKVAGIRALSREAARAADAGSIASKIQESLRRILGDSGLTASISTPGDGAPVNHNPRNRLAFPLDPEAKQKGYLVIRYSREEEFSEEILEALGDLALHAAIAMEMREQRRLKEQVARGEQLAASSLLLAGIARELRPQLEDILREARQLGRQGLTSEAESALGLVDRLAAFGQRELARACVFDLSGMLRELSELRRRAWRLMQLDAQTRLSANPLPVRAPRGLVEEAALGLIVALEQLHQGAASPRLMLAAEERGDAAVILLSFGAAHTVPAPPADSVSACRSLLESAGGRMEIVRGAHELRFEIQLPLERRSLPNESRPRAAAPARQLTLLLVHPDAEALRPLIRALAERSHRAVPAADALQALEMAARLHFDVVFVSPAQPDMEWADFAARAGRHVPAVGWLSTSSRPAPPGVPVLSLHPGENILEDQLAVLEGTARPPESSMSS